MGTAQDIKPAKAGTAKKRAVKAEPVPVGPDSYTWKDFGSHIFFLTLPEAFILQAAHPVINSAVTTTKKYKTDPWGRAKDSLKMLWPVIYARPEKAIENGRKVREWHRPIKGVDKDGNKFHALDPEAYSWVHMTGFDATVRTYKFFVDQPLTDSQRAQMFEEWKQMGRMLGVDPRYIPETEEEYWKEFNRMIEERLVDTEVLYHGLHLQEFASDLPKPPGMSHLPDFVWKAMVAPPAFFYARLIAATLPENFRERFGVKYSKLDDGLFKAFAWSVRKVYPRIPESRRYIGLAWRAIEDARKHPEAYAI